MSALAESDDSAPISPVVRLLGEVLDAAPEDVETLLGLLIEPAAPAAWRLDAFPRLAFPRLAGSATQARSVLGQAAATGARGVNALFYGPPGTGKTELARALADACGLRAFQVRSADEEADGLSREGRLSAYLLAQRLRANRRDAVLIFDKIEDVLDSANPLRAPLSGESVTGCPI